jgi:hypothetical protein
MYTPEWEIEELIAQNPKLVGFPSRKLKLLERQKYLKKIGRYIDLLFKQRDYYLLVEVKSNFVDDKSVILDQVIPYKKALAEELSVQEDKILCTIISPVGFSREIENLCKEMGIVTRIIDKCKLTNALKFSIKNMNLNKETNDISTLSFNQSIENTRIKELANLFIKISNSAPIMAHEVYSGSNGKLTSNNEMWFWLFYSVMDRRANASTFIKAKEALERERLFTPYKIVNLVKVRGERTALNKIAKILEQNNFPLLNDNIMGKLSFPKSIVDAAKFLGLYSYDFMCLYEVYVKKYNGNLKRARDSLWNDLQESIYGVGPRIASQIIRGLVLKGPWNFPLDDNKFLEKCRYNVWIAGNSRLGLIEDESEYNEKLGRFADDFLNGNRGIIAHVLWFIRKRYCNRPPKCHECPLNNFCLRASLSLKTSR